IRRHEWLAVLGQAVRTPRGAAGLCLAAVVAGIAAAGPFVAPHAPAALLTVPFAKPSAHFPLGADFLGRDVLSRMLAGGWQLLLTYSIIIMSGLAFLGFGPPPPAPNWGTLINENRVGLPLNPWAVIAPAAVIAVLTIGTNLFTDAVGRVALGADRRPGEAALL